MSSRPRPGLGPPRALRVASRTGSALAANGTASGKALLAELPDAEVTAIFAGSGGQEGQLRGAAGIT